MQGTQVQSLVQKDSTCYVAIKPMYHNYWAWTPEPESCNYLAHKLQLLKPAHSRDHAPQQENQPQWEANALQLETSPCLPQLEKTLKQQWRASTAKNKWIK